MANIYVEFQFVSWYAVQTDEYEYQSAWYVELKDEIRPKIIKKAFDLNTAIVELHSHVHLGPAGFSESDLHGLYDFVPHVRWRLKGKPYAAIVISRSDFDGLVWMNGNKEPQQLNGLKVDGKKFYSNGITLTNLSQDHEYRSF